MGRKKCKGMSPSCTKISLKIFIFILCTFISLASILWISVSVPFSRVYTVFHSDGELLQRADRLNEARLQEATAYFQSRNKIEKHLTYIDMKNTSLDLVICIVTASRKSSNKLGYLLQTAAWMDRMVKDDIYFKQKFLFLCNVNTNPYDHEHAQDLTRSLHYVQKYGNSSFSLHRVKRNEKKLDLESGQKRMKELEDYAFCLNVTYSLNSTLVLMLEDDTLPRSDVFKVLYNVIQQRFQRKSHPFDDKPVSKSFSFLKLYYPEKWLGYAFEMSRLLELASVSVIGGALLVGLNYLSSKSRTAYQTQCLIFLLGCLIMATVVSIIGRQTVLELRRISPQLYSLSQSPGCCTPAMLYNTTIIPFLSHHLLENAHLHKDLAIYDFIKRYNLPAYYIEPNLFYHIGMYSSLHGSHKPAKEFQFDLQ